MAASSGGKPRSRNTLPEDFLTTFFIVLPSNLFVSLSSNFNIMLIRFSCLLLKRMENMDSIFEVSYVDNAPLSKNVNTNFLNSSSYTGHRFPIARYKPALNGIQFKTRCFTRFFGKIPKIVQARTYEIYRFH